MRILSIIIAFCACVSTLGAEESIMHCPLKAAVFYSYPSTNIGGRVKAGDKINITISIRNISTNLIVLSLGGYLHYNYRGQPNIILSNFIDKITGAETRWLAPGGGGGAERLDGGPLVSNPPVAQSYVFIKPEHRWWKDMEFVVPANLGDYPFTEMEYSATIYEQDSGELYGLNAWTGKIEVTSCTVPLRKSNQKNCQPTNAPYSQPQTVEKRYDLKSFGK